MSKKLVQSEEFSPIFNRLIGICDSKKYSVSNLLDKFATSRSAINAWKKGNISAGTTAKIAEALDVSIDYLITGKEKEINATTLKQNEIELLEIFKNFDDREQIKIIGRMEEWLETKRQREAISKSQRIVGVQVARRTDGKFVKKPVTAEEMEKIKALPEDTDY